MGALEIIIFALWVLCVMIQLFRSNSFGRFIVGSLADAVVLGFIYAILHLAIKYW